MRLSKTQAPNRLEPEKSVALAEGYLGTAHLAANLKDRTARGAAYSLVAQAGSFALQMVGIVVMSRLLTPADFGLVAMVTAVVGIAGLFVDLGLSAATIQAKRLSQGQVSTLFWVNIALGGVLTGSVALAAPGIAWTYGEPRLLPVGLALSVTFVVSGLGVQHRALLMRQMRYGWLAVVNLGGLALGMTIGIGMALGGQGYWSLVAMAIAQPLAATGLAWVGSGWRPGPPVKGSGIRGMIGFGRDLVGVAAIQYLGRNLDVAGIGAVHGVDAAGLFSRAYQIFALPASQMSAPLYGVLVPALSRLVSDPPRFAVYYAHALSLLTWASALGAVATFAAANALISVLFGPNWIEAAAILRNLALALALQPLMTTVGWVFTSRGQGRRYLGWSAGTAVANLGAMLLALPAGPAAVALAEASAAWLLILPWTLYCLSQSGEGVGAAAARAIWLPLLGGAAGIGAVALLAPVPVP